MPMCPSVYPTSDPPSHLGPIRSTEQLRTRHESLEDVAQIDWPSAATLAVLERGLRRVSAI
jgi:hypothetical protein